MTFPVDKLGIINEALALTGNNLVNVEEDGSDEWNTTSAAYEAALPYAIESGDWKFATTVVTLNRQGTPTDPKFTDAYDKPPGLLHLIWVRLDDQPCSYAILDSQIVLSADSGVVTAKYVRAPDTTKVTPMFAMALRTFVISGIYRGLHEDNAEAEKMWKAGEGFLQLARTRSDQEQPKRAMFNSRIVASRRVRRPWPVTPSGWTGTGNPR